MEGFFFCARETEVTSAEGHRATRVWSVAPAVFGKLDTNANRARSRGQAEIRINVYGSKRVLPITFPLLLREPLRGEAVRDLRNNG